MEVDDFILIQPPSSELAIRQVSVSSNYEPKGLDLSTLIDNSRTIEVLQVIEWFPYVGVWIGIKVVEGYDILNLRTNIRKSNNEPSSIKLISITSADVLLDESLKVNGWQFWFVLIMTSLPIVLEVITSEIQMKNQLPLNLESTSDELYIYRENTLGRKTLFYLSDVHITYTSTMRLLPSLQVEHFIYFLEGLSNCWKFLPLNQKIRSFLIEYIYGGNEFYGDMCYPWHYGESKTEEPVFLFIPPLDEADNERCGFDLFGNDTKYNYKGILLMAREQDILEKIYGILEKAIANQAEDDDDGSMDI